ncbi:MAG: GNAT family N-acetyltransferase [Bacteroidetes bacterium]|nr:GNAT family N-acetyltransferase [Bacteroidota bacterium]
MNDPVKFTHLDWDTSFFKRKIGRIDLFTSDESKLIDILEIKINENYDLFYLYTGSRLLSVDTQEKYNAKLVDRKVLYSKHIQSQSDETDIEEYSDTQISQNLIGLAYQSGTYSRFKDNKFMPGDFERLYKTWLENSIQGIIADKVFVSWNHGDIYAFVTVKIHNETGVIGLISVSPELQGKGIGLKLIRKVECFLHEKGIKTLLVATQAENDIACRFYQKAQFLIKEENNIYHIWH